MQNPFMSTAFKPDLAFTGAAERFFELLKSFSLPGAAAGGAPTLDGALKLYELWVNCAEESYAATVRKEEFCRLQAQLANASAALLVEQRRHAETLVRAFGLPSRNEVDALYAQLKELRRQLAELAEAARSRGAGAPRPARPAGTGRRKRPRKARA